MFGLRSMFGQYMNPPLRSDWYFLHNASAAVGRTTGRRHQRCTMHRHGGVGSAAPAPRKMQGGTGAGDRFVAGGGGGNRPPFQGSTDLPPAAGQAVAVSANGNCGIGAARAGKRRHFGHFGRPKRRVPGAQKKQNDAEKKQGSHIHERTRY